MLSKAKVLKELIISELASEGFNVLNFSENHDFSSKDFVKTTFYLEKKLENNKLQEIFENFTWRLIFEIKMKDKIVLKELECLGNCQRAVFDDYKELLEEDIRKQLRVWNKKWK
jgi:hypothetical protein